jgi:hypothetical protein
VLDNLTYKQKTILLLIAGIVVFILGRSSIEATFDLYADINQKELDIKNAKSAPNDILKYEQELVQLNYKVGKVKPSFEQFQKEVLNCLVPFVNRQKIKLKEIKQPHYANKSGYQIQTLEITSIGSFKKLSLLIDHLQKENTGRICAVNYNLKKDNKTKKWFLESTIFIQNYKAI